MAVDPENDPRPGDLQYNLLWKILERLTHVTGGGGGGGTPGGVNANVQFNDAGAFGGASDFLYNSGTGQVSLLSLNVNSKIILNAVGSAAFASGGMIIDSTGNVVVGLANVHTDGSAAFANASTVLAADGAVSFLYGATAFNSDGSVDFSGSLDMGSHPIHSVTDPALPQDAATKAYADAIASAAASAIALKVSKSGDTMTGALNMNGNTFINPNGSIAMLNAFIDADGSADFANGAILFNADSSASFVFNAVTFNADGTVDFTNVLDMGSNKITSVSNPTLPQDAATKAYADTKQTALGFTPENVANKDTDGTLAANSDVKYPSQKAVKTYADTKQTALGFTPENVANKDIDGTLAANSDTKYASQKATKTYADTKQTALGFTPENVANKDVDGTLAANSDTKYPSQKAVKTYVDAGLATKQASLGFTPEDVANKSTAVALGASNTLYPSQNAVKAYVDAVPNRFNTPAAGTAYTVTATSAKVTFGTTSPTITIDKAGTYWISTHVSIDFAGATFPAGRQLTVKLRRTNNTAADLTGSGSTFNIPVVNTVTHTMAVITLPPVLYTTANTDDLIEVWASVTVLPSAGNLQIRFPTVIQAVRLLTG
jgi:hypothetical protein